MKLKILGSSLLIFIMILLSNLHLYGDVKLSKIYLSNKGQLEQVVISINSFKLFFNNKGQIQKIVTESNGNLEYDYRVQDDKLEKLNYDKLEYRFEKVRVIQIDSTGEKISYVVKERLYYIGGEKIEYMPLYPDRIKNIGNLEFQYYRTGLGLELIKYIDDIYFYYRYPDYRVENIGNATFEYFLHHQYKIKRINGTIDDKNKVLIHIQSELDFY